MDETFVLEFKKDTQGTYVYATTDPFAPTKSVYVAKTAFPRGTQPPAAIELTIKATTAVAV